MKRQVREKARILAGSNGPAGGPLAVSAEGPAMSGLGIGISRIAMFRLQAKNRSSGLQFRSCMNLNFICFIYKLLNDSKYGMILVKIFFDFL